jgi:hypothetical protein
VKATRNRSLSKQTPAITGQRAIVLATYLRAVEAGQVPADPNFFKALRIQLEKDKFDAPYAQHPWVYAANQAITTPITLVPFRLYKAKGGAGGDTFGNRVDVLRSVLRKNGVFVRDVDLEAVAFYNSPRERFRALARNTWARKLAPHMLAAATQGVEVVQAGKWYKLFQRPNPEFTRAQLWEATFIHLGVWGEGFWMLGGEVAPKVAENEIPDEIWPCGPDRWEPIIDKTKKVPTRWVYKEPGARKPDPWELFQIVHTLYYNPYVPFRGLSPIEPSRLELEQSYLASHYNRAFFKNGAIPGGYLMTDKTMNEDAALDYLQRFEQRHGGAKKGHRPMLLDAGMKFIESMSNHKDMEFGQLMDRTRDTVLAGSYRTTKNMTGLSSDQNRASMDASIRNHWESVLLPKTHYLEDKLDSDLFTDARAAVEGEIWGAWDTSTVPALRDDMTAKLDHAKVLMGLTYPVNVINEALELHLPALKWGDVGWKPSGLEPMTDAPEEPEPEAEEEPKADDDPPAGKDDEDEKDEEKDDDTKDDKKAALRAHAREYRAAHGPAIVHRASVFHTVDHWQYLIEQLFVSNEEAYGRKFKRYLYQLRTAQLEAIRQAESITTTEKMLFPLAHWQKEAGDTMRPLYVKIFDHAAAEAVDEVSKLRKSAKARKTRRDFYVEKLTKDLGRTTKTVRKQLVNALDAVVERGDYDKADLNSAVRDVFNQLAKGGKVGVISRTETSSTIALARDAIFDELDVTEHSWLTAGDEDVRDNHVIYGEQGAVPRGTNFASFVGESYTLHFPLDPNCSSASEKVGCRCVNVPE